jgi:hypothetical protein
VKIEALAFDTNVASFFSVIPAKAGIQGRSIGPATLDARFRGCKEIGWIDAVRASRRPLRGLLSMRIFLCAAKICPHPEERPVGTRLEGRTAGRAKSLHSLFRGNDTEEEASFAPHALALR